MSRSPTDGNIGYVTFQTAEVLVSKSLFHEILVKIHRLKLVPIGYDYSVTFVDLTTDESIELAGEDFPIFVPSSNYVLRSG